MHDSAEVVVGGRATLLGVRVQARPPVVGATVEERVTVPLNVPLVATVIVEVAAVPAFTVTLVGLALRLMPGGGPVGLIVTLTVVELVMSLFVPPDATLNVGAVKPLVATAEKATLSTAQPNPPQPLPAGKPFSAVAVIVTEGPAAPLRAVTLGADEVMATKGGLTELSKSVPD